MAYLEAEKSIGDDSERLAQAYTLAAQNLDLDLEKSKDYYQSSINLRSNKNDLLNFENYKGLGSISADEGNFALQLELSLIHI